MRNAGPKVARGRNYLRKIVPTGRAIPDPTSRSPRQPDMRWARFGVRVPRAGQAVELAAVFRGWRSIV